MMSSHLTVSICSVCNQVIDLLEIQLSKGWVHRDTPVYGPKHEAIPTEGKIWR